jgi:cytochrome b pre-mRNA-processing protein 3
MCRIAECDLPLTFQTWFTVTNLHVWLLTVRFRAMPPKHGMHYVQGLIDHFFFDVEDGVRYVLQPSVQSKRIPTAADFIDPQLRGNGVAPERLVGQQMRIFKEQWGGLGLACDYGLVKSDTELAAAMWRNVLGARGAKGLAYDPDTPFRRSVNPYGRQEEVKIIGKKLDKEESKDDLSGVHDYAPAEVDKYLKYPELMETLVEYIRREVDRLDKISDDDLAEGDISKLHFGPLIIPKD